MAWINKVGPWVKVYTAKCTTESSRALNGLVCILGGGKLTLSLLNAGVNCCQL